MDKLFPCHLYKFEVPNYKELNKKLVTEIYELRDSDKALGIKIFKSNMGGWHSSYTDSNFKELSKIICNFFSKKVLNADNNLKISKIWANINSKNCHNRVHIHPYSYYVGIYYVKVPENSGNLCFINPCSLGSSIRTIRHSSELYGNKDMESKYSPKEGDMYFFNGRLPHRVGMNPTDHDRISIAFNFDYKDLKAQWKQNMETDTAK